MTERGLPIADGAAACPFVAFDDQRDDRSDHPDPRHRCYAESPPTPRARAHQEAYCLSANFPVCPTFQDWARREAARVLPTAAAGTPAERLRDVPAQREAGSRPPTFGAGDGAAGSTGGPADTLTGAGADTVPPAPPSQPGDAMPDPIVDGQQGIDDRADDAREPWDLPPRRPTQPGWSAPPPWSAARSAAADDDEPQPPDFLRTAAVAATAAASDESMWSRRASTPAAADAANPDADGTAVDDGLAGAGAAAGPYDANAARLRAMGLSPSSGDDPRAPAPPRPAGSDAASVAAAAAARPVAGVTRSVDPGTADELPGGTRKPSRSLAGILGWDRRPRAGGARANRKAAIEPAWERPRRFEAYPTLKTRVGLPIPSRAVLALLAILVAAAILFFVPPLLLRQGGGAGSGASPTPGASAGASGAVGSGAAGSAGPTAKPTAAHKTYTIKQGDTLSTIAKKFGVTVDAILAANKQIKNPNRIAVGDVIVIPTGAPTTVVDGGASASP